MSEEFEASKLSVARTISSHSSASSDSTAPLLTGHPLTHASPTPTPTPTPTRVSFHRRTARIAVRTQPTLSSGMSTRITKATTLSPSSFRKRYRSSYETPSPSSSMTLPIQKRYWGTSELSLDIETEDESSDLDAEGEGSKDKGLGLDNEGHGLKYEGPGSEEKEEASPEGQQQAVSVVDTSVDEPLSLGYGALRCHELASGEGSVPSTFKAPPAAPVQTPPFPEWSSGSLPVSPLETDINEKDRKRSQKRQNRAWNGRA
ncbi:hypothetical protein Tco_0061970 [Tanacetum coccineum]